MDDDAEWLDEHAADREALAADTERRGQMLPDVHTEINDLWVLHSLSDQRAEEILQELPPDLAAQWKGVRADEPTEGVPAGHSG